MPWLAPLLTQRAQVTSHSWTLRNGSAVDRLPTSLVGPHAMQRLHYLSLNMQMRSNDLCPEIINPRRCIQWSVQLTYRNVDDSRVEARLKSLPRRCGIPNAVWPLSLYLILATGSIAAVYEILVFKVGNPHPLPRLAYPHPHPPSAQAVLRDLHLILLLRRQGGAPRQGSPPPSASQGGELRNAASLNEAAAADDEKAVPGAGIAGSSVTWSPREQRDPDSPGCGQASLPLLSGARDAVGTLTVAYVAYRRGWTQTVERVLQRRQPPAAHMGGRHRHQQRVRPRSRCHGWTARHSPNSPPSHPSLSRQLCDRLCRRGRICRVRGAEGR